MPRRLSLHRIQACALIAGVPIAAAAAGGSATASRAELERWFGTLRMQNSLNLAAPQRWEYSFVAADGRALEALSVARADGGFAWSPLSRSDL